MTLASGRPRGNAPRTRIVSPGIRGGDLVVEKLPQRFGRCGQRLPIIVIRATPYPRGSISMLRSNRPSSVESFRMRAHSEGASNASSRHTPSRASRWCTEPQSIRSDRCCRARRLGSGVTVRFGGRGTSRPAFDPMGTKPRAKAEASFANASTCSAFHRSGAIVAARHELPRPVEADESSLRALRPIRDRFAS